MDRDGEKGQALVLTLIVLAVAMILSAATLTLATSHRLSVVKSIDRAQAFYTAQAGVERALAMIKNNPGLLEEISKEPYILISMEPYIERGDKKSYIERVTAERLDEGGQRYRITSVGIFGNAKKTATAEIEVIKRSSNWSELLKGIGVIPDEKEDVLVRDGSVFIKAKEGTNPTFYINGGLDIQSAYMNVKGFEMFLSEEVRIKSGNADFPDTSVEEYYGNIPALSALDAETLKSLAEDYDQCFQGDKIFSQNNYSGVYYVNGDIRFSGTINYRGRAVIFAEGKLEVVSNSVHLRPKTEDDILLIITREGVRISSSYVDIMALMVTEGKVEILNGSGNLEGAIVSKGLEVKSAYLSIECDPSLVERHSDVLELAFGESGGASDVDIKMKSWSEQ